MSPEMKRMIGMRINNDDGFTYVSGKGKGALQKRTRWNNLIKRCKRSDKRSVRAKEDRRMQRDIDEEPTDLGFLDYGDFVNALTDKYGARDDQEYFDFFEQCERTTHFFNGCTSYDEAIDRVTTSYLTKRDSND